MSFEFFEFSSQISHLWDNFVLNSEYGSIHQISDWKKFQEKIPGREKVLGFGIKKGNTILATVFCVQMKIGLGEKFWWYSARGPVFDPEKNIEAGALLIQETIKKLKTTKGIFWRIDPYFSLKQEEKIFSKIPFHFQTSLQNYQPTDTLEIDLTKPNEEILTEMKRKGRYNINLAQKKGIQISILENRKITAEDIDDFWKLNTETTCRDSFFGHEKKYYENFLKTLPRESVLFFAEYQGKRIATAISTFCGTKAIYYFGASTSNPEYRNLMGPYLLQWEMMQYAKKRNCKTYDFLGIAPEGEKNHSYSGISEFKWKFGGERKTYAPGKEIILNPLWYKIYKGMKYLKRFF